jgi:hypothetical protein
MTQLVIGAALGFILGECVLVSLKHLVRFLQRYEVRTWLPQLSALRSPTLMGRMVRQASVFAAVAGVLALAAWAATDYLAARDAQRSVSTSPASAVVAPPLYPDDVADQEAAFAHTSPVSSAVPLADADPYADPDFKAPRPPHHPGTSQRLTETLLHQSEAKARAELLKETQEHEQRSQYDCEAAVRARRYLKGGLDVWGFAAWQAKYFPMDTYKGATLAQCRAIKNRLDSSGMDAKETVVAEDHATARAPDR